MLHDDRIDALSLAFFSLTPIPVHDITVPQQVDRIVLVHCKYDPKWLDILLELGKGTKLAIVPPPKEVSSEVSKWLMQ